MSEKLTTEKPASSKRQQILQAGADIFSTKGFYGAKIEDIAQAAEIGKGTVYEYFKSKEELFNELIKEGFNCLENMLMEELRGACTAREKMEVIIRVKLSFNQRYSKMARIVMLENIPFEDSFRDWLKEMHIRHLGAIEAIIQEGVKNKEIAEIDARLFALIFFGGLAMIGNPLVQGELTEAEIAGMAADIIDFYFLGVGSASFAGKKGASA